MRNILAILTLIILMAWVPAAVAKGGGNHQSVLNQRWRPIEAQQKLQTAHFKTLEREAAKGIEALGHETGGTERGNTICDYCVFCRGVVK